MAPKPPFIVDESGAMDTTEIRKEAYPIAGLIALFGGLALIPLVIVFLLGGSSPLGFLFMLVTQFILAIGAGIVLMYIMARAIQMADEAAAESAT